jgi:hypothetical protein
MAQPATWTKRRTSPVTTATSPTTIRTVTADNVKSQDRRTGSRSHTS